jgi:hypothetical protein
MGTGEQLLRENSIYGFVVLNGLQTETGQKLSWDKHNFLFDIYNDWTPVQAIIKASQIGFSTMVILKALFAAKYKNYNIIYTLPTSGDVNEFVSSKVNKIIYNSSFLKTLVKDKDSIFQKQIGNNVIFFKGTASGKAAEHKSEAGVGIMISSDLNIHDESDRSDQTMIEQYESRLDFSQYKGRWYFSNPTVPKVGAHKHFLLSDQKHFFHKCSRCNEWFFLEWNDLCVNKETKQYTCPKCKNPLSEEDRGKGEWVKKYKAREISGYWINQMMAPWKSCEELLEKENNNSKAYFNNFCLGLPYIGSDITVNREVIVRNIVLTENKKQNVAMGVDNGNEKHYLIGNEEGIFALGKTKDWAEIERLRTLYNATMVIDALPYPKKPAELVSQNRNKVFMSFYKKDKDDLAVIRWGKKEKAGTVYADRTKLFDEVIAQIFNGKISYNLSHIELEEYIAHWESLSFIKLKDSMGIERGVWESSNGVDHYAHATNLWYMALQRLKQGGGEVLDTVPTGEKVYSPKIDNEGNIQDETTSTDYIFANERGGKDWSEY